MAVSDTELAWSAGFFDGEGYTGLSKISKTILKSSGKRYNRKSYKRYPTMNIAQTLSSDLLDRFNIATGNIGKVYGPYGPYKANKKPYWTFQVSGYERVVQVLNKIYPYMSDVKKKQANNVLTAYLEQDTNENSSS